MEANTCAEAIAAYVAWCGHEHAASTTRLYGNRLASLARQHGQLPLSQLSEAQVLGWIEPFRAMAPDTVRATVIAFNQFQKWAIKNGLLSAPIATAIKKPTGRLRLRIPTAEELQQLLAKAPPEFAVIFRALRECGARPDELCRATIADWRREKRLIVLERHKTAKKTGLPREIPVGDRFAKTLLEAIGTRVAGPIFLNSRARAWSPQRISAIYRGLRDAAGLPKDLVLYLARHEHGTKIYQLHKDLKAAADALGHKSTRTTERYVHTTPEQRAATQDVIDL